MKQFMQQVVIPMCLVLVTVLWAGCIQPNKPIDRGCTRPEVLVFSASWCGPCQRDKVVLAQVEAMGAVVQVVDIDARPDLMQKYSVTSVPTYFVYVCGRSVQRTNDVSVVVSVLRPLFRR